MARPPNKLNEKWPQQQSTIEGDPRKCNADYRVKWLEQTEGTIVRVLGIRDMCICESRCKLVRFMQKNNRRVACSKVKAKNTEVTTKSCMYVFGRYCDRI